MTLDDLYEKYGEEIDWQTVDAYDFYDYLDNSRYEFKALYEEGILNQHHIYPHVRERCIRDLFFLNLFCWDSQPDGGLDKPLSQNLMTHENHDRMVEMFVKKDPTKSIANQSKIKDGVILYPRGTLKTYWGYLDIIQWVLLDHTIRILILTAADDLASSTVDAVKSYLIIRDEYFSLMNLFWPEHCFIPKDKGASGTYTSPQWAKKQIDRREPTIMALGITSTASGFHFEVIVGDDAISDRNSLNETQCEVVNKRWGLTRRTRLAYGYTTFLGTRYHEADLYGQMISNAQLGKYETEEFGICANKITNQEKGIVILVGAAMVIKPDCELDLVNKGVPQREWYRKAGRLGIEILMPNVPTMTYDTLLAQAEETPDAFQTQMCQNVLSAIESPFTDEVLKKATVSWTEIPPFGRVTQTWDFAGSKGKKDNDNSVGTNCIWSQQGVGYINDLVRANFSSPLALAKAVVEFACKYHPEVISIEDSPGARNLYPTIEREADTYRHPRTQESDEYVKNIVRRIHWRHVDNQKDAKKNRINTLQPLLVYGRIKFVTTLPYLKNLYEEFKRKITTGSKNDIPDAISFQRDFMPFMPSSSQDEDKIKKNREEELRKQMKDERDKSAWFQMFEETQSVWYGNDTPSQQQEYLLDENFNISHEEGLDNILGAGLIG